jgi:tRNA(fMet)-specific endonuclease VapC
VELADQDRRSARPAFVDDVVATIAIEDYTPGVAVAHAKLLAHVRRAGRPRGAHDLVIAATGRTVLTSDASAGLAELPGVDALVVAQAG